MAFEGWQLWQVRQQWQGGVRTKGDKRMFAVSNYYRYELVDAETSLEAALLFTGERSLKLLNSEELNHDSTVIAAMCLKYTEEVELLFESFSIDIDRVFIYGCF